MTAFAEYESALDRLKKIKNATGAIPTKPTKPPFVGFVSSPPGDIPVFSREQMKRPYCFKLRDGEGGGTYLTTAPDLEAARDELRKVYGDRLLMVTAHGCAA